MGKTTLSRNVPKRLLKHTFLRKEKIDITQFVQNYSELIIYIRPAVSPLRWQPPQVIPKDLLMANTSYTMYFEGGTHATDSAYTGYRFTIFYDGTNWYMNVDWMYWEGNTSNSHIVIYGR